MLIALALFLGCPEPPSEVGANNGGGGGTPMGNPANNGVTPPPEGAAPGPADGPGAPPPYDPEIELTQEALKDMDHITITGDLKCETEGPYVIHLFPPPPEGEEGAIEEGPPPRPLAGAKVKEAGEFTFMAPKGGTGMVLGFIDTDDDNIPSEAGIFFANKSMPISLEADTKVSLDCSESAPPVAEMPPGEGAAPPPGGEMPPPPTPPGAEGEAGAPPAGEAPPPAEGAPAEAPAEGAPAPE